MKFTTLLLALVAAIAAQVAIAGAIRGTCTFSNCPTQYKACFALNNACSKMTPMGVSFTLGYASGKVTGTIVVNGITGSISVGDGAAVFTLSGEWNSLVGIPGKYNWKAEASLNLGDITKSTLIFSIAPAGPIVIKSNSLWQDSAKSQGPTISLHVLPNLAASVAVYWESKSGEFSAAVTLTFSLTQFSFTYSGVFFSDITVNLAGSLAYAGNDVSFSAEIIITPASLFAPGTTGYKTMQAIGSLMPNVNDWAVCKSICSPRVCAPRWLGGGCIGGGCVNPPTKGMCDSFMNFRNYFLSPNTVDWKAFSLQAKLSGALGTSGIPAFEVQVSINVPGVQTITATVGWTRGTKFTDAFGQFKDRMWNSFKDAVNKWVGFKIFLELDAEEQSRVMFLSALKAGIEAEENGESAVEAADAVTAKFSAEVEAEAEVEDEEDDE